MPAAEPSDPQVAVPPSGAPTSRLAASFLPATAVLELTYACNHQCLFCSCPWFAPHGRYDVRRELGLDEWKEVIERLCRMGVHDLSFTGGEPLLVPGVEELLRHAAACRTERVVSVGAALAVEEGPPALHLLTNGELLTERILELCAELRVHVGMSLPGLRTFADHTGCDSAAHVLSWFARARELGVATHVGITVTRRNLHELYETIAEALLAGAGSVLLNRFLPGGRGLAHERELALDVEGVHRMLETAEEVLRRANRRGNVGTELPLCVVAGHTLQHLDVASRCAAATDFFAVDPSGFLRVCNHSELRLGHVTEIGAVKDHPHWRRFAVRDHLPAACGACREAGSCDAGCREAALIRFGAVDAPDPLLPPRRA